MRRHAAEFGTSVSTLVVELSYRPRSGSPVANQVLRFPVDSAFRPSDGIETERHPPSSRRGQGLVETWVPICARSNTPCKAFANFTSEKRNLQFSEIV